MIWAAIARKVHFKEIASPGHNQLSAPACLKSDAFPWPILTIEEKQKRSPVLHGRKAQPLWSE